MECIGFIRQPGRKGSFEPSDIITSHCNFTSGRICVFHKDDNNMSQKKKNDVMNIVQILHIDVIN